MYPNVVLLVLSEHSWRHAWFTSRDACSFKNSRLLILVVFWPNLKAWGFQHRSESGDGAGSSATFGHWRWKEGPKRCLAKGFWRVTLVDRIQYMDHTDLTRSIKKQRDRLPLTFISWRLTKAQHVLLWFLPCFYPNFCSHFLHFIVSDNLAKTPGSQHHKDLTYQDKKISGSAFKHAPDRQVSLHHGTILTLRHSWMSMRPSQPWVLEVILHQFWHVG